MCLMRKSWKWLSILQQPVKRETAFQICFPIGFGRRGDG